MKLHYNKPEATRLLYTERKLKAIGFSTAVLGIGGTPYYVVVFLLSSDLPLLLILGCSAVLYYQPRNGDHALKQWIKPSLDHEIQVSHAVPKMYLYSR